MAEAEALRRAKGRTPQAPLIPYFLTAGGQEIVGLLDTGSSHFLVKKEIFEKMEGKEVVAPTSYKGVEGGASAATKGEASKMSNLLWGDRLYSLPSVGPISSGGFGPTANWSGNGVGGEEGTQVLDFKIAEEQQQKVGTECEGKAERDEVSESSEGVCSQQDRESLKRKQQTSPEHKV